MSATNEIPRNRSVLLPLAHQMLHGLSTLQNGVGLHHHRDTTLRPLILALEGDAAAAVGSVANMGSQLVYKLADEAANEAVSAMKTLSDGPVKTLLAAYRKVLEGVHGRRRNTGWAAAGFTESTAVPTFHDQRFTLLTRMRAYLDAHPNHGAILPQPDGLPLIVSAATALALLAQFDAARALVNATSAAASQVKQQRDADLLALYKEVSGTAGELRMLLADNDSRWVSFGLNIPDQRHATTTRSVLRLTTSSPAPTLAMKQQADSALDHGALSPAISATSDQETAEPRRWASRFPPRIRRRGHGVCRLIRRGKMRRTIGRDFADDFSGKAYWQPS